jgi:hypothetical protein
MRCHFCNEPIEPNARDTWTLIVGWERKATGQSRRAGSDIVLRERRDVFACGDCIRRQKMGLSVEQGSLL